MKTWHKKNGQWYLGDKLIKNPKAYGAKMMRGFLDRERDADDKRPIHFSLDMPIDPRYAKPLPSDDGMGRTRENCWGMPLADDEPLKPFEFYRKQMELFIEYARQYTRISKSESEWLLRMLWVIYGCVHENREKGKLAVREALSGALSIVIRDGRLAKFVGLFDDIAATPGWYAISREGATIEEALNINHAARHHWEHPRDHEIRRGLRRYIPKRAHRRKK